MGALQTVRRELRQRSSEKLKELYRITKLQSGSSGGDDGMNGSDTTGGPSIMDDTYGEIETGDTAADAAGGGQNNAAIARLEKKASGPSVYFTNTSFACADAVRGVVVRSSQVDLLTEHMDYMVRSFNAAAGLADG